MVVKYDDDHQDKTPVSKNGYTISYAHPRWKAVKNGVIEFSDRKKNTVISWAEKN